MQCKGRGNTVHSSITGHSHGGNVEMLIVVLLHVHTEAQEPCRFAGFEVYANDWLYEKCLKVLILILANVKGIAEVTNNER